MIWFQEIKEEAVKVNGTGRKLIDENSADNSSDNLEQDQYSRGKRSRSIVKGNAFSTVEIIPDKKNWTDINALAVSTFRLSYMICGR